MTPTLSLALPSFGAEAPEGGWRTIVDVARAAEDAGADRLVVSDHVVLGPNVADYPWGRFPTEPDGHWLEPLTVLTAIAAVTTRVRLATGILIAPLRPAPVLAKAVATLDHLSGGRVDLGVGTGWQREEYDAAGLDFERRGPLLTETITMCRALWEGRVPDVWCEPKPLQPRLPVWFSGTLTPRNIRRIVELGDGWIPVTTATPDEIAHGIARLHTEFETAGRDPASLQIQASARTADAVPALAAAGVTTINMFLRLTALGELVTSFRRALDR